MCFCGFFVLCGVSDTRFRASVEYAFCLVGVLGFVFDGKRDPTKGRVGYLLFQSFTVVL